MSITSGFLSLIVEVDLLTDLYQNVLEYSMSVFIEVKKKCLFYQSINKYECNTIKLISTVENNLNIQLEADKYTNFFSFNFPHSQFFSLQQRKTIQVNLHKDTISTKNHPSCKQGCGPT